MSQRFFQRRPLTSVEEGGAAIKGHGADMEAAQAVSEGIELGVEGSPFSAECVALIRLQLLNKSTTTAPTLALQLGFPNQQRAA